MKNIVLWIIVACSIGLGATGINFLVEASNVHPETNATLLILREVSGGVCLLIAAMLLIFSGIMFHISDRKP